MSKIPQLLQLIVKVFPARVTVVVNLFGEVRLPSSPAADD